MIRGTTPTHIFNLPFDTSLVADLRIIYAQNDKEILVKKLEDCTLEGQSVSLILKEWETFLFDCSKKNVQIQLRVVTHNGEVLTSSIKTVSVDKCLNHEVLQWF